MSSPTQKASLLAMLIVVGVVVIAELGRRSDKWNRIEQDKAFARRKAGRPSEPVEAMRYAVEYWTKKARQFKRGVYLETRKRS